MKNLIRKGVLPFLALFIVLSTGCQFQPDPNTDLEETIPDFRDAFTGEFDFSWSHQIVRDGDTTTTSGVHSGLIYKVGTEMIDIQYRPEAMRRMFITSGGALTDAASSQDGFVASGTYTGSDALTMSISSTTGSSLVYLNIAGTRK